MTIDRTRIKKQQPKPHQQSQQQPKKGKRVVLPQTSTSIRLQDNQDKFNKMDLAERIAKKEALLKLPDTQTREIFSVALSERAKIPFIRLPDSENVPQSSQLNDSRHHNHDEQVDDEEESDDSDVEDVEELFLELAQELDSEDKVTQQRLTRVAKEQHDQTAPPSTIALPQSMFTFPSNDYFSPGAPFLASTGSPMTPQPEKRQRTSVICTPTPEPDPPTINVRIAGGDIIQDVFLSPIVERPPTTPQQHIHHGTNNVGWIEHETYQTRVDEEQLMHGVHPFSLRPPPHLMRSRRQSRTTQQGITESRSMNNLQQQISSSSALSDGPETKSQASSKNSSTSAVSPRFMALRKLSEVALMAPYSKPPPPPPPPTTQSSSENSSIAPDTTDLNYNLNEQRLLERIDDLIESRLKSNISEILWRATESHRDARRFWEEQRRDMLELGSSILHKLSNTADQLKHQQYRERKEGEEEEEEQELENLRKLRIDLENEVSGYQLKQIAQQTEIQSMRHRNLELEKEVEAYRQRNSDLEAQVARLGVHHGSNVVQDRPCVTPVTVETRDVQTDNIGIIMDWADVVAEEEWANKYSELESRYDIANNKIAELEKKLSLQQRQQHSHHYQQRPTSRSATRSPLSQSRPASSMALVAPPLSLTTNNTPATSTRATSPPVSSKQRKHKSMTPTTPNNKERKASHRQSYFMNEEGHLTFTTEINGRLSQYTVKLPGKEGNSNHSNNNNYYNNSTKLNPLAQPWKTPATMST